MYTNSFQDNEVFNPERLRTLLGDTMRPEKAFKQILHEGNLVLRERLEVGYPEQEIVARRAWLMDCVLVEAWQRFLSTPQQKMALIAVGGYGRKELHPASDVDILVVLEQEPTPMDSEALQGFLTFLWDIKLEVGHSVRTPLQCQEAAADITVMTNLVESRFLTGIESLFYIMQGAVSPTRIWPSKAFFKAKLQEQRNRRMRYFDTEYNLEPNLKECPGGLRDIQMIGWVAKRHFGANTLHDLVRHGFLTEREYATLNQSQTFLWRVRSMLHHITGRHQDRLGFDDQRAIAKKLGYRDTPQKLAVEQFMKEYYGVAKEISGLNEMLLQLFQEAIVYDGPVQTTPINRRFQITNGYIEVTHERVFEHYPFALLEIFLLMQQDRQIRGIRAATMRLIRQNLFLIDEVFHADLRARSLFYEILRQPSGQTTALRAMNRLGVLAAYIPAFGKIVGLMQHDLFHAYTVDQHTLFVLRNVRRMAVAQFNHELPLCSEIMQRFAKSELLYLGALFHDIAKGRGGDHSELGQNDALKFCLSHGMSDQDARFVAWLVKHHLIMSITAQREDLSDPEVIQAFAHKMGDNEHLNALFLLTVADIRGTNARLWNDWKAGLLLDLYRKTRRVLTEGVEHTLDRHQQMRIVQNKAKALLQKAQWPTKLEEVEQFWRSVDDEYFLRTSPEEVATETQLILRHPPPLAIHRQDAKNGTEFLVYAPDRDNLLATTALFLEQQNVSVMGAEIMTTRDGNTLNQYIILDEEGAIIQDPQRLAIIRQGLLDAAGGKNITTKITRRAAREVHFFPVPTRVTFSQDNHHQHTIMEVITTDYPGVLSRILQALVCCEARVKSAKIATFGSRVEDLFYITDSQGAILQDSEQCECIRGQISRLLGDDVTKHKKP